MNIELKTRSEIEIHHDTKPVKLYSREELLEFKKNHHIGTIDAIYKPIEKGVIKTEFSHYATTEIIVYKREVIYTYYEVYEVYKEIGEWADDTYQIGSKDENSIKFFLKKEDALAYGEKWGLMINCVEIIVGIEEKEIKKGDL